MRRPSARHLQLYSDVATKVVLRTLPVLDAQRICSISSTKRVPPFRVFTMFGSPLLSAEGGHNFFFPFPPLSLFFKQEQTLFKDLRR